MVAAQRFDDSALGGSSRSGATGTISLSAHSPERRNAGVTVAVSSGTADFALWVGADAASLGILEAVTGKAGWAFRVDAPWGAMELRWANNGAVVVAGAQFWD